VSCSFAKAVLTPGSSAVTTQLTLTANGASTSASLLGSHGTFALWLPGLFGMFVFGDRKRSRKFWLTMGLLAILVMALLATGCGGGAKSASSPTQSQTSTSASQAGTYQISILAQAGSFQRTTSATVTIK
jgi:hypothetical protein